MKRENWFQAIDEATNRHRKPTHDQIIEVARELFPDDFQVDNERVLQRGWKAELKDAMRSALNIEEIEPAKGDTQLDLPGMIPPAYIGVPGDEGNESLPVKYRHSTRPERRLAIKERERVRDSINKRIKDLKKKEKFLDPYVAHEWETLQETLAKIKNWKVS